MRNKQRVLRLTLAAFFVAIEIVLAITPLGYIPIGAISITTLHIPVILGGVLMGPGFGAMVGFVFGMTKTFLKGEPYEGGSIPQGVGENDGGKVLWKETVEQSPAETTGERCHDKHEIH